MFKAVCDDYTGLYQGEEGVATDKQLQIRISGSDVHTGKV